VTSPPAADFGAGRDLAILLISRRCAKANSGGRPPFYVG